MNLPTLIAGPILRRVEPTSVTVWLAFSKKQTTRLVIWDNAEVEGTIEEAIAPTPNLNQSEIFKTIEIANKLHIAVITLDMSATKLKEDSIYCYNIYFSDPDTALDNDLGTVGLLHTPDSPLGYIQGRLPTIIIPPRTLDTLNIIHGSCRKIHGGGDDAFRHIDSLISKNVADLDKRPQQLFLTGDQIYADEIPQLVLPFINALGSKLFGDTEEKLVIDATSADNVKTIPADMQHFPSGGRQYVQNKIAMFTGNGTSSHLLAFHEFCATYLYYWSPEMWSPDLKLMLIEYKKSGYDETIGSFHYYYLINILRTLDRNMDVPVFPGETEEESKNKTDLINNIQDLFVADQVPAMTDDMAKFRDAWEVYNSIPEFENIIRSMMIVESLDVQQKKVLSSIYSLDSVLSESRSSSDFLQVLPYTRRALANIPSYMIFDDHDMTDDWNFSQFWKNRVHTSSLGIQVLRNAMMAYTIFQDWGNVPNEYPYDLLIPAGDTTDIQNKENAYRNTFKKTKGNKLGLLKKIIEYGKSLSNGDSPELFSDLANALDKLLLVGEPTADDNSFISPVRWHFNIHTGGAHTFFLDTRTRREYDDFIIAPGLLSKEALDDQLPETIAEENYSVVFVVSPVPALSLPVIEEFAQPLEGGIEGGFNSQGVGGAPVGAISGALKRDNEAWGFSEKHLEMFLERLAIFKKVVIFSGDVHFGFSTYADYWKERKQSNHARIIQLVSSPLKNGWDLEFALLKSGFAQRLLSGFGYEFEKHGWKGKTLTFTGSLAPRHRMRLRKDPVVLPRQGWHNGSTIDPAEPDWVWRLRIAIDTAEYEDFPNPSSGLFTPLPLKVETDLPEPPEEDPTTHQIPKLNTEVLEAIKKTIFQMADRHNSLFRMGRNRRIIWQPNIGHVYFTNIDGDAGRLALNHSFHYSCRIDGFLNSDYAPDPDIARVLSGAFTLHTINLDVSEEEGKVPKTLNEIT